MFVTKGVSKISSCLGPPQTHLGPPINAEIEQITGVTIDENVITPFDLV